ncbi:uncharacterized protein LOC114323416 [Camellia sinensis]|uniref:uncharacterized protein LOC114323416 n=1 Tax=Camellia sinensis TaxID=4442 RepID=UPI001035F922|nr:uncharacterized protein LOC114323416 [Camellia sinensis]
MTTTLRMLTYEITADCMDEYLRIGESTALNSLKKFVKAIVVIYSDKYLKPSNNDDIARLLTVGESRGFPGMLGSIDCMHWKWKSCLTVLSEMYTSQIHEPTIILEAVASYDLWIWHAFFGLPGSHNDINVLDRSPIFAELAEGYGPPVNYSINSNDYTIGYYLADEIYPQWSTFACVVLHNMIVEDDRDVNGSEDFNSDAIDGSSQKPVSHEHTPEFMEFIQNHHLIRDKETHSRLQADFVEHLWQVHGQSC